MVCQMRVDERLVHGQITTNWARMLSPDFIIVANDDIANDKVTTNSLLMAQPAGVKVRVRSIPAAIDVLNDPRSDTRNFMVIVSNLDDALTLLENVPDIHSINVANQTAKKADNKIQVAKTIRLTPEDLETLKKITEKCDDVFSQLLPLNTKEDMKSLLSKL